MLEEQLKKIRGAQRISAAEVIDHLTTDFFTIHGDRLQADDPAVTVGYGRFKQQTVLFVGVNRGATLKQRLDYHFGALSPAGYRKVSRGLVQAEKFGWPVITLINMPGAAADVAAELNGQSQALAATISQMGRLTVPNIALFLGEGESGGALALANCNRILMLENSLYSVASPEAVQAILKGEPQELTQYLPMTADQLVKLGLVDQMISEAEQLLPRIEHALQQQLKELQTWSVAQLQQQRTEKYLAVLAQFN
ncbi:carboxyltransferase subunit alpha [Loigolactobacillus zhaoyuanensis]|uniref:acetyl-CoA carboxytransferase n=1 Tax=Loigolactobacillus zhaoyuanensis TaxID=2486017 RepID=A0ABW8UDU9_9LACO|nr:carboxyltransferase subunit alpha [Loigolactobacillus zhaoyuanensis]